MKPVRVYPESNRRGFVQIIIVAVIALVFGAAAIFGYQKFLKKSPVVGQKTETKASPMASADETANLKTYTNTKYGISFEYPSNFIECGCAFGGPITTKGELLTMPADPNTIRRGTDARFDGIAVYIVSETDFNNFVLAEKSALLKLYNNKGAHDEKVNIGGHSGIELVSYSPFGSNLIYLPLSNGVLVLSTLEVSENHFASLNQILSTFKFTSGETANWKTYKSTSCPVIISYPQSWNITDLKLARVDYLGNILGCFKITSPEYVAKLGEEAGGRINISKLVLGSVISDSKINNFDDYITVLKKQGPVTNLQDKQYGTIIGKQYVTSGFFVETNFVFAKDNNLFIISWNNDSFLDSEKKLIDQILSTFKFTN